MLFRPWFSTLLCIYRPIFPQTGFLVYLSIILYSAKIVPLRHSLASLAWQDHQCSLWSIFLIWKRIGNFIPPPNRSMYQEKEKNLWFYSKFRFWSCYIYFIFLCDYWDERKNSESGFWINRSNHIFFVLTYIHLAWVVLAALF